MQAGVLRIKDIGYFNDALIAKCNGGLESQRKAFGETF